MAVREAGGAVVAVREAGGAVVVARASEKGAAQVAAGQKVLHLEDPSVDRRVLHQQDLSALQKLQVGQVNATGTGVGVW